MIDTYNPEVQVRNSETRIQEGFESLFQIPEEFAPAAEDAECIRSRELSQRARMISLAYRSKLLIEETEGMVAPNNINPTVKPDEISVAAFKTAIVAFKDEQGIIPNEKQSPSQKDMLNRYTKGLLSGNHVSVEELQSDSIPSPALGYAQGIDQAKELSAQSIGLPFRAWNLSASSRKFTRRTRRLVRSARRMFSNEMC